MRSELVHQSLIEIAQAVEIHSPTQFSLLGEMRDVTKMQLAIPPGQGAAREPLLQALEAELYQRLYSKSRSSSAPTTTADPAAAREFIGALSRANRGSGTWEAGWVVAAVEADGRIAVRRDGVTFWARPSQVRGRSDAPTPGQPCEVRLEKEIRHLFSGFYMALGNALPDGGALLRLYWHLTPAAAIRYIQLATDRLNRAAIPFKTKVLSKPEQYLRADAGVLYVNRADFDQLRPIIRELYAELGPSLHKEVPMFTRALAPGLGLAEDPRGGQSFGQSRCRVAAEALQAGYAMGLQEQSARLEALAEAFRQAGLDPLRPYLEPGSADQYDLAR